MGIKDYANDLELTLTDKTIDLSFSVCCEIYETKFKGIFVTDYNLHLKLLSVLTKNCENVLKDKNCVFLFNKNKELLISAKVLKDKKLFNKILLNFKNNY